MTETVPTFFVLCFLVAVFFPGLYWWTRFCLWALGVFSEEEKEGDRWSDPRSVNDL